MCPTIGLQVVTTILVVIITGTVSLHMNCPYNLSVELVNRTYNGVKYPDDKVYFDKETNTERGCECLANKDKCASKCCPLGQVYDYTNRSCVQSNITFNPELWEENKLMADLTATEELSFMIGFKECNEPEIRMLMFPNYPLMRLRTDGQLDVHLTDSTSSIYGADKYCIETFVDDKNNNTKLNAVFCLLQIDTSNTALNSTCMLISCFFILLTVTVYAFLPELRNLHGLVLMAYLLSFFVGFLLFTIMQIIVVRITQETCTILTFIIYFSLLSAFFWLNVMCYDIWWTFSGKRAASGRRGSVMKQFYCYAGYAFGVPTALTVILAALEFSDLPDHPLLPKLRLQGCFLYGTSKLIYLYGPIVILCVANMIFFTLTAIKIAKIKKDTAMLRSKDSSTHDQDRRDTQRFLLYIKLFAVMGINWILEVVSSFYPEADFIWQFTDAYNVLVGLIIFIIFVFKKKTFKLIKKRFKHLKSGSGMSRPQTTTSTSTRTLSSQSRDEVQMSSVKTNATAIAE